MQNLRQMMIFIHAISDKKKIGFSIFLSIIAILIPINARGGIRQERRQEKCRTADYNRQRAKKAGKCNAFRPLEALIFHEIS